MALAQVEGQEMWESGFQVGVVVGSSAPLHTAAVAPWIARERVGGGLFGSVGADRPFPFQKDHPRGAGRP